MQKLIDISGKSEKHYKSADVFIKRINVFWLMLMVLFIAALPNTSFSKSAPPPMVPASFSDIADEARPAVVNIGTTKNIRGGGRVFNHFFGQPFGGDEMLRQFMAPFLEQQPKQYEQNSLGSGFIVSPEGYIVTNNHVIEGADSISVKMYDNKEYDAKLIGRDPKTDLALIKIDAKALAYLQLGNSSDLKVGTWVVAIGSPFGLEQTVTAGIVSAKGRILGSGPYDDFIQTDASINPGNSGGPLLNLEGEVVGINTAIIQSGQGIGFAIPSDLAKGIVEQLKSSGEVTRGWLGVAIQDITPELAQYYGLKERDGVLVGTVYKDHPADKAGIKAGDIIIRINDETVNTSRELSTSIARHAVGEKVDVAFVRDGQIKIVKVTLAKRSDSDQVEQSLSQSDGGSFDEFGMNLTTLNEDIASQFGYDPRAQGLVVANLEADSKAARAGIRVGDILREVNRRTVENTNQYNSIMKQIPKGSSVQLLFIRGNSSFVAVRLVK
ncbi:MAG: DegQ family serine endoprotease [Desulfamplus sp.]|nr:DegQ family serine endoprotease [Desulfamplus sp.]MBF0413470.1 DegQ family serine endoprotease [Desulfamplus sp.]